MSSLSSPQAAERASRRRAMAALLAGAALMNAAMAVASAVSTIAAAQTLGASSGAIPNCAATGGTGIGAIALTRLMQRRGRRTVFMTAYTAAGLGGLLAATGAARHDPAALSGGMLLLGLGNAAAQLSRYAAADLYPPRRRAAAIGALLWAVTAGAVGGPLLMAPAGAVTTVLGGPAIAGPFLFAALTGAAAAAASARLPSLTAGRATSPARLREVTRAAAGLKALAVMVTAQVIMVAVMTATPLAMAMSDQGLDMVDMVLSAHIFGMFALSPLTGWLTDRFGAKLAMFTGLTVLAAATALAAGTGGLAWPHTVALFLLGYGWNLCFIGGSAHLARDLPALERIRIEGAVDGGVWASAAVASLCSTALLATAGYSALTGCAGILVALPALALARKRRVIYSQPADTGKATAHGALERNRNGRSGVRAPGARPFPDGHE
jgi:MFS family permease